MLPSFLPAYDRLAGRRFRFLAQKSELVRQATEGWEVGKLVNSFSITPRFELEARLLEPKESVLEIVVLASVTMQWRIAAPLRDLANAGVPLEGLFVVYRDPPPMGPVLAGRIASLDDRVLQLSQSIAGDIEVSAGEMQLEGSRKNFETCLRRLLLEKYSEFEERRERLEASFRTGAALNGVLEKLRNSCKKNSPIRLGAGVNAAIGGFVSFHNDQEYATYKQWPEVQYCFSSDRTQKHRFAWTGLEKYGPFDKDVFEFRSIKVLVVVPSTAVDTVGKATQLLKEGQKSGQFARGFCQLFSLQNIRFDFCEIRGVRFDAQTIGKTYLKAIEEHLANQARYNCALVAIDDRFARLPDALNPYLFSKSILLSHGIPAQEVRLSTLRKRDLGYTLRNVAVAMYAKMNGVPWTVDHVKSFDDEIIVGIGTSELSGSRSESRQRFVGITTVFQGDGNFILSNVSRECRFHEYPELLRENLSSVLAEVRQRNGWRVGDRVRVVIHTPKPLKNVEMDEIARDCLEAVNTGQDIQFASLEISLDHPFKVFDFGQKGRQVSDTETIGAYVPHRGLMIQLGANTRLLVTNGPHQIKRAVTPLPSPLLIHLHGKSTSRDLDALTEQVLKFTSLTWRSTLPAEKPVTISYSELIAELLARLRAVPGWNLSMLNTRLKAIKWFL